MTKPCTCGTPGAIGKCHFCVKFETDDRYRRLWSGRRQRFKWTSLRRFYSFLRAITRHALAGFPTVNPLIRARRMATCRACPQFNAKRQSCKKCGCALKLKTAWKLETCPLSKW